MFAKVERNPQRSGQKRSPVSQTLWLNNGEVKERTNEEQTEMGNIPCLIALEQAYDHEGKEVEYELPLPELPLPQADLP